MKESMKQLLAYTLLNLCEEKPLNKITVSELVEKCGISRHSFYKNFRDINDLIYWTYSRMILRVGKDWESVTFEERMKVATAAMKRKKRYQPFLEQAFAMRGQNCLLEHMFEVCIAIEKASIARQYNITEYTPDQYYAFLYHAYGGVMSQAAWIVNGMPGDPEDFCRRETTARFAIFDALFHKKPEESGNQ